jgi:hypothetical protein
MTKIMAIVSVLRELFNLVRSLMAMIEKKKLTDEYDRQLALSKATNDLKNAKTAEEIKDAQRRIVDNSN